MASEPVRLLAKGVPVVLADGEEYRLIVDLEALCVIEDEAGSLLSFLDSRNKGYAGKKVKAIRIGLHAALSHTGMSAKKIDTLIDHRSLEALQRYDDALGEALNQGLPDATEAPASGKGSTKTKDSTGSTSTGSEPSDSDVATVSSGE